MADIAIRDEPVLEPEPDIRDFDDRLRLVLMVIDDLFSAVFKAAASGVPARVEVPDEETADLFRAALATTEKFRPADKLVDIVVRD